LFEREHHRRIATVLEALDADVLLANRCLFGGGTAIALRYGEYRESIDIDFLVSDLEGYRALRQRLSGPAGMRAIERPRSARAKAAFDQVREVRADQYGVRTMLQVDGFNIKFEVVLEGRITLDPPGPDDRICGVAALTPLDMAASKLLANSDRWADDAVMSRDLIDLAMMQPSKALLKQAIAKAKRAYGESIEADLAKAIDHLRARPHRLDQCMEAMRITMVPKALLWKRIKALAPRVRSPSAAGA
jgi:hypothetical protein